MLRMRYVLDGEECFFPLTGANKVRLGRGSDNDIVLSDVSVSRYHAELRRGGGGWSVHDLKSTNGVELNRVPVHMAPLHAGDRLGIGVFELLVENQADVRPAKPVDEDTAPLASLTNATIVRPLADFAEAFDLVGISGKSGMAAPLPAGEAPDLAYATRMFGFLTRLARILIDAQTVDDVLRRVLDIAFEAVPVDRGFILLSDSSGELVCELARIKDRVEMRPEGEVPVSRTMLRAVMRERVALVTFDAQSDQRLSGGESIRLHQIRAAMCAPLWSGERIIGVMQVDSPFQVGAFGERDLDFLTTLANYVAVAVERIRYARQAELERMVRTRLERYHSAAVIEEVLRQGEDEVARRPKLTQATVLFADLVGFTAFCERSGPEDVSDLLGAFLDLAVEAIFRAGGTLDKFIGDCVMAFFGAPVPQADHAVRATRAAIEIQRELTAWSAARNADGLPGFAARVALNSGPVVVGDIGSARRVDYTVLGNTVNVAARLEAFVAKPGDVVLGPETYRLLDGAIPTEPLGEFQLKGLQKKIMAYRVAGV
ncbi:MAG TPA: adenylate/guanylate cyclase domain-containing protein [Thermoanaerobaculia bacterium]|jgi:adenylate cyclase|nr:adenylate/guanylate cyclase domain-containing protein [Thermoanaerobaculia bacterium]